MACPNDLKDKPHRLNESFHNERSARKVLGKAGLSGCCMLLTFLVGLDYPAA